MRHAPGYVSNAAAAHGCAYDLLRGHNKIKGLLPYKWRSKASHSLFSVRACCFAGLALLLLLHLLLRLLLLLFIFLLLLPLLVLFLLLLSCGAL